MVALPFVYLTSPPFSGSTLFSFLANTHPQIATVGEMTGLIKSNDPAIYSCSCGLLIPQCDFWRDVSVRMAERHFEFDSAYFDTKLKLNSSRFAQRLFDASMPATALENLRDRLIRAWPPHRNRLAFLVARNKALARSILQVTGKSVFFDASKSTGIIRFLSREPDVDFKVIHLVRDVRGASFSRRKNRGETDWPRVVNKWIHTNRNIERQLERLPADRWIRVRYEDVCRSPVDTMNRFFSFCGLEQSDVTENIQSAPHHIIGNRMRLGNSNKIRLDESWRSGISLDDQIYADKLAGSMQVRYGYESMVSSDLNLDAK